MPNILLASKTTIPKISKQVIHRQRLTAMFQQAQAKLIVVQAPAGYGKTTLVSSWFYQLDTAVAWYTVDQTDNDPMRYWKLFLHAISHALPRESVARLTAILHAQPQLPLAYLVDTFLHELAQSTKGIHIMIDDYHHIHNEAIHQMMTRLIDFLPEHCVIYLASRSTVSLPVIKWRLNHCLVEIGVEQLLFTYKEIKEFYDKLDRQMDTKELQEIFDRIEGWAIGLQLTHLARFSNVGDEPLKESNSYVAQYLVKEIFAKLDPPLQTFLLYTSLLEQLTPATCNLLTARHDAQQVLVELEKQGLFISRIEAQQQIYKYHNLFRQTLRQELQKQFSHQDILALYEKAAVSLYNSGHFLSAIELALSGEIFTYAEQWIHEHIVTFLSCGQSTSYINWMNILLANGCEVHPELMVMYAYTLAVLHNLDEAYQMIVELEQKNEANQWMEKAEYASAVDDFLGVKAYIVVMKNGNLAQGAEYIRQRLERKPAGSKWDAIFIQYNQKEHMLFRTNIGSKGKLLSDEQAMSFFAKFRTGEFRDLSMTGYSYGMRAEKLYEWHRFDELSIELEEALRAGHQFQDAGLLVPMYMLKSKIAVLDNQYIVAQAVLDHTMEIVSERYWIDMIRVMKALVFLRENHIAQAEQELAKIEENIAIDSPFYSLVKARILLMREQLLEAEQLIVEVRSQAEQQGQLSTCIEAMNLFAICLAEQEQTEVALWTLHHALKLAEPYQYTRTFIDEPQTFALLKDYVAIRQQSSDKEWLEVSMNYVKHLLECARKHKQMSILESLSAREQEIFTLLSAGASNKEIAEQLFLSEGTIRVYLSGIYRKLGVKNRAQAILLKPME